MTRAQVRRQHRNSRTQVYRRDATSCSVRLIKERGQPPSEHTRGREGHTGISTAVDAHHGQAICGGPATRCGWGLSCVLVGGHKRLACGDLTIDEERPTVVDENLRAFVDR